MKTMLKTMVLAGVLAAGAFAQERTIAKVDVPFEFRAGSTLLPAGTYVVAQDARSGLVTLASPAAKPKIVLMSNALSAGAKDNGAAMVFYRYGGERVLAEVWEGLTGRAFANAAPKNAGGYQVALVHGAR